MKCPECGQWNRASLPRCSSCGTPLHDPDAMGPEWKKALKDDQKSTQYLRMDEYGETEQKPDERDTLAREMYALKDRKISGARELKRLRRENGKHGAPSVPMTIRTSDETAAFWQPEEEPGSTVQTRRMSEPEEERPDPRARGDGHRIHFMDSEGNWLERDSYNPIRTEQSVYSAWGSTVRVNDPRAARARRRKRFLIVCLVMLFCCAAAFGVWKIRDKYIREPEAVENPNVLINASILDDLAAHTIRIPGQEGQQIYIRELHSSYLVTGGYATVEIADHTWYDDYEGTLGDTMDVTLTPFMKAASGKQDPMDPIRYTVDIPISPIELTSPDGLRTDVSTTMFTLKFAVRPGSRVTINGEDCSDTVSSETGELSYNATVQPIGDNVFHVVVRSPYCRDNTLDVTLYRAPQEIPLDLAVGIYGSTDSDHMKVSATTLPGATIDVLSPFTDMNISELDSTGKFTFQAKFDKIGNNTIVITASYPGKKTSRVEHTVYYLPPASEYTKKAWPLSESGYSDLLNNGEYRKSYGQIYLVTGVVQYVVSEKPQMVVINTSPDGKSQPVLVENYTKTTWQVGTYYRIYADANGTYDSMPRLNARFTYFN